MSFTYEINISPPNMLQIIRICCHSQASEETILVVNRETYFCKNMVYQSNILKLKDKESYPCV
jgi:hypothetical protein